VINSERQRGVRGRITSRPCRGDVGAYIRCVYTCGTHARGYVRTRDIVFARYNSTSVTVIAVIVASYAGISRQSVSSTTRPMLGRI